MSALRRASKNRCARAIIKNDDWQHDSAAVYLHRILSQERNAHGVKIKMRRMLPRVYLARMRTSAAYAINNDDLPAYII